MSAKEAATKETEEVRIRFPLQAYVRFSRQMDGQLARLEERVYAAVPQLARRGLVSQRRRERS